MNIRTKTIPNYAKTMMSSVFLISGFMFDLSCVEYSDFNDKLNQVEFLKVS